MQRPMSLKHVDDAIMAIPVWVKCYACGKQLAVLSKVFDDDGDIVLIVDQCAACYSEAKEAGHIECDHH